ncbi:MAG: hypothetical protein F4X91_14490 [Nitrospinae bacterium]|nr:hypothetical protein [Nitrospinota bacterium]
MADTWVASILGEGDTHPSCHAPGEEELSTLPISENPDYPPYTRLAQDVHFLGKALWVVRRM